MIKRTFNASYKVAKRIVIGVIGFSVVLLGVIMLVTPGPAFVVIPAGLAVLSLEFAFARRWLQTLRKKISEQGENWRGRKADQHRS